MIKTLTDYTIEWRENAVVLSDEIAPSRENFEFALEHGWLFHQVCNFYICLVTKL